MSVDRYGATKQEWKAFYKIAAKDLMPMVCDPDVKPLKGSKVKDPSKVPSLLSIKNGERVYYGIRDWTTRSAKKSSIQRYMKQPVYGICLVGRTFKAVDIDVNDKKEARAIERTVKDYFGGNVYVRRRPGSHRCLILFRCSFDFEKISFKTPNGVIEFLGSNQHFSVAGTHLKSGTRYTWDEIPASRKDVIELDEEDLNELIEILADDFAVEDDIEELQSRMNYDIEERALTQIDSKDKEMRFVRDSDYFIRFLSDGKMAVRCPWEDEHTSAEGKFDGNESATVYLPSGLGGRKQSAFKCMHTSHGPKNVTQFLQAIGYVPDEFEIITAAEDNPLKDMPSFIGADKRGIPGTLANIAAALMSPGWSGVMLGLDEFTKLMYFQLPDMKKMEPISDTAYTRIHMHLEANRGMIKIGSATVKDAVRMIAERNTTDSAIKWLKSQTWDGKKRVERFAVDILGCEDTAYTRAVSKYLWTALAGRVLIPGEQADMIPVLVGKQGCRKTTIVHSLPPKRDWVAEIDISKKDDDNARLMQGKVVVELAELKGLTSKAEEFIKAFVSKTRDAWIPKYHEFETTALRRMIMIGTTNVPKFLSDITGNRRWLPLKVCMMFDQIKIDEFIDEREQYWAEGREMFEKHGVMWKEAEQEGAKVTEMFMLEDAWTGVIRSWLEYQGTDSFSAESFTSAQVLQLAVGIPNSQIDRRYQNRVEGILTALGCIEDVSTGQWRSMLY